MSDIVYYRKMAQIMVRDGETYNLRNTAATLLETRNPKRRDKHTVKSWMYTWVDNMTNTHHSHINAWWREKHR